jgi:hypothetical protein
MRARSPQAQAEDEVKLDAEERTQWKPARMC